MTAEVCPRECSSAIKGCLSFIMARWDVLQSSFPDVNYSVHDDFSLRIGKFFLLQTAETCPPMNAQRVKGSPIHLIAGDRPPSTQSILSASVIRILGGQRRQRREEPG
ncbi:hypothetical protein CEXT_544261 [Caerostris extrusa]|uniref:Uncharacterized protein n=1 Tax=Caerostris extrusa TaxID=172846 RepID=A0AAV4QDE6_CAEEX|nr:hypothetical protein CEXT_544261 [Caerostris extrusa]